MSTSSEETRNRAKSVVRSALARKAEERAQFIREACRNDVTLIREVESLLDSYEQLEQRLQSSEGDAAALGRKIGKYEVLERVGQGAMGVVYKARDPLMRRLVGIKVMSAEIASDSELRKRFYGEARSAGNLSHKNIITIHDLGEDQGRPYIAMEFLSGEDLKSKLDRRARITLEDRLRWMREMTEGLEHAHGKDVIHRDIKPANVFITRDGEIKILDFGLARLTSSVATKTGHVMGTPSYMSPEQVRGDKTLDHRSDLFSAGSTFYELLSYRKPFPGDTIHGVFYKILESDPDPLRRLNPWLPEELEAIVAKAMAKEREARYQRAEEILRDLRGVEASLGERKRALRTQALEALAEVESVLGAIRELARRMDISVDADETMTVLFGEGDPSEEPTVNEMLPQDYFGLVKTIVDARAETKRLGGELSNLEKSHRLLEQALDAEANGKSNEALELADGALRLCPGHARASQLADRLSLALASRDPNWSEKRIGGLVAEGEARLEKGTLPAAGERFARVLALEPGNLRAAALKTKLVAAMDRERAKREAREQAERLVAVARGKLAKEDDPAGCLELVRRALELDADHSDARDLKDKAENRLAQQRSLAAEETAAEAIAAATLAMRRGELTVAEKELARASRVNPSATEIPALTLLLERAQRATEATEIVTQREREFRPRTPPAGKAERPEPRPAANRTWMLLGGGAIAVVLAGIATFGALGTRQLTPVAPEPAPAPTTALPTSTVPLETTVPPQTTVPTTTEVPPRSTSTSTVTPRSSSTVAPSSTTSVVPRSTTAPLTTTMVVTTTAAVVVPDVAATPEAQIADLMRRYEAAYEGLDVNALGAIYPSVPLSVKSSFQNFKTLELDMAPIAPPEVSRSTAGPTASAVYRIVQTVEPKVGKKTVSRHRASFLFAGVGTAWIIVRVDWESE